MCIYLYIHRHSNIQIKYVYVNVTPANLTSWNYYNWKKLAIYNRLIPSRYMCIYIYITLIIYTISWISTYIYIQYHWYSPTSGSSMSRTKRSRITTETLPSWPQEGSTMYMGKPWENHGKAVGKWRFHSGE